MTRDDAQRWLQKYVEYRYHPYDEPLRGRDAIVASWLEEGSWDEPGTWDAHYDVLVADGNVVVATGTSTYLTQGGEIDRVYYNNFVLEFDDDQRCKSFTEYYMQEPKSGNA